MFETGMCMARRRLFAAVLMSIPGLSEAQNVSPEDELKQKIKIVEEIRPLGENPFGEKISLYSGAISFIQTDVSLSGQGPCWRLPAHSKVKVDY